MIITLILLRVSAYFRDSYRANNYAASDLVELIREIDKAIDKAITDKTEKNINRIKLSFIAHSMGCFVTTNTIRILSDVFKTNDMDDTKISDIGKCFTLSRLILIAPDIPVETIIPRRANFLQASLRRFKESYIFSNEGDIVLRIASTAANYFSFPAKDRFGGYRLGNITVKHDNQKSIEYGIINLNSDLDPFTLLEVRSSNQEKKTLEEFVDGSSKQNIANKFTYFDCTDYKDQKNGKNVTPVSLATKKQALGLLGYTQLFIDHLILGKIDTHGGYFDGNFTKELIHKLAFFGFDGLLKSYSSEAQTESTDTLSELSKKCQEKQIQVVLSPQRMPKH